MKITIGVNQKVGLPNYGSAGASCEVTLDLAEASVSEHPESLVDEIRRAQALCQQAVAEQLAKSAPPPPEPQPDRRGLPSQGRPESLPDRDPEYHEPGRPPARREPDRREPGRPPRRQPEPQEPRQEAYRNGTRTERYADGSTTQRGTPGGRPHDGPPKTGRELYPWIKKQQEAGNRGAYAAVQALGERNGYPEKFSDWNREETRHAVEVVRELAETAADGGSNGNGYHN